ncbi:MAG: endolytic transglycosylase MltG [Synechococcus sp.]
MGWVRNCIRLVLATGIVASTAAVGGWYGWRRLSAPVVDPASDASTIRITIEPGSNLRDISQQLQAEGVLRSAASLELWMRLKDLEPKAGSFNFDPRLRTPEIAAVLHDGRGVGIQFTIPEGWRLTQMAAYFADLDWFSTEEFLTAAEPKNWTQYEWLPANLPHLEGWLFPDTYQISPDRRTPEAAIARMLKKFETTALPLYQDYVASHPNPKLTLLEWVTLSSIVEKEAVLPAERPEIAGVFSNRLVRGIPLGSDPTVEYAFNITQTPDRRLTYEEVGRPSPYNTYVTAGLPPTAIASPGLASLTATLSPATTDNLYFVARYDGSHVFSKTYEQHLAAQREIVREHQLKPNGSE